MLTSFSSPLEILLLALSLSAASWVAKSSGDEFLGGSAELQSVNSYLTAIGPLSMDPSSVVTHLEAARALVDSVGDDNIWNDVESEVGGPIMSCLFGNNPNSLRTILNGLIEASKECNQETVDFLTVAKNQTFVGQFLHSYTQRRMEDCQQCQAELVANKVEKSLGKISSEVYELMADLAQAYVARNKKVNTNRGQIVISDSQKSVDPSEVLRTLKQVKLDTLTQQRLLATIIRNYYAEEFPTERGEQVTPLMRQERLRNFFIDKLINPCQEIMDRWMRVINYPTFVRISRQKLSQTIEGRRKTNWILDWSVEMVRICHKIRDKSNSILTSVEK